MGQIYWANLLTPSPFVPDCERLDLLRHDLIRAPYVLHGVKYIDLVSLARFPGDAAAGIIRFSTSIECRLCIDRDGGGKKTKEELCNEQRTSGCPKVGPKDFGV